MSSGNTDSISLSEINPASVIEKGGLSGEGNVGGQNQHRRVIAEEVPRVPMPTTNRWTLLSRPSVLEGDDIISDSLLMFLSHR